ncbi:MAG: cyclase family protein [Cyclobacteriaceae bacterium]
MAAIVDLTRTYDNAMPGFQTTPAKTLQNDGWNAAQLNIYSHAGTHMDAPLHFGVSESSIDEYPPNRFIVGCYVVSITITQPSQLLGIESVQFLKGRLRPGQGILFRTGWSKKYGSSEYRDALPRISDELADWLVENEVAFIGVEPPSVADVNNIEEVTRIHRKLLNGDIIIVEGLTNLESLKVEFLQVIALPLKIFNGDGAPARVLAIQL